MKKVLTIAGSDCSGGAGIQADLKTMCALGVFGMSVITAVTAQNTQAVLDVQEIDVHMVKKQIQAVYDDISVDAVKIGMVSSCEIIRSIRDSLLEYHAKNIVVDPVMVSKSGYHLLREDAVDAVKELVAIADIVTPNIPEAELLAGISIEDEAAMEKAAKIILGMGAKSVLVKGGHRVNNASDVLLTASGYTVLAGERINTNNTHGTGCTLSSAIASFLTKDLPLEEAVAEAKAYITQAINDSFSIGHGVGPVGHLNGLYRRAGMEF